MHQIYPPDTGASPVIQEWGGYEKYQYRIILYRNEVPVFIIWTNLRVVRSHAWDFIICIFSR